MRMDQKEVVSKIDQREINRRGLKEPYEEEDLTDIKGKFQIVKDLSGTGVRMIMNL